MKIRPVAAELFHTDGVMTKIIVAFRNFANATDASFHPVIKRGTKIRKANVLTGKCRPKILSDVTITLQWILQKLDGMM
jgi:hypothetical protein